MYLLFQDLAAYLLGGERNEGLVVVNDESSTVAEELPSSTNFVSVSR